MNRKLILQDLSVVVVLGILCGLVYGQVQNAPPSWFPGDIGVAAVPGLVNAALGFLLLLLAGRVLIGWKKLQTNENIASDRQALSRWLQPAGVTLLYLGFLVLVAHTPLPFTLLAAVFLVLSFWLLLGPGLRHGMISLAMGLTVAVICTAVFNRLFGVVLP